MPKAPSQRGLASRSDDWGSSGKRPLALSVFASQIHTPPFVALRHLPPARGKSFLKGRGLGKEMNFAWIAKGSHFEGRRPPAGGRCRAATKGGIWQSRQALTERARMLTMCVILGFCQSFLGTGISKPQPSLAQYSLPPLRNRVLPHFSHLVATGISQVIKSQSG